MRFALVCFLLALAAAPLLDSLTNTLLLLTTFLFLVVSRYAVRYMQGDPRHSRFTVWLGITGGCVFAVILAQNLLFFALAWCGTSLSLHHLLQFYKDRPGALLAARKKFLISRLGDACLVAALFLTRETFGTWDFHRMFAMAAGSRSNLDAISVLLVFAALLKSAQFPFHSWLPDTMETPTPVSALMHAGIINAGGILVIRLSPLIRQSQVALSILCLVGAFTAIFASLAMLTQSSIKRCLAFSTVAQMGFMMLECGLGAFHLALLHLIAHSLYKAYAFLSSGGAVLRKPRAKAMQVSPLSMTLGLFGGVFLIFSAAKIFSIDLTDHLVLAGIVSLAIAQMLWIVGSPIGVLLGIGIGICYFALERVAAEIVTPYYWDSRWLALPILAVFGLVVVLQAQLPRFTQSSLGQRLYVQARNGFYFNTMANRLTLALWPVKAVQENA